MTLLEVSGLQKSFASRKRFGKAASSDNLAVQDVSFTIDRGETLALVGESGAGKSTVGRLICRLIEPDAGEVRLEGEDVRAIERSDARRLRREVQMIFQDPYSSFDPRVTLGESIAEPLLVHFKMKRAERRSRALELLHRVGMSIEHLDRFPRELSGGQLQRAAVARALTVEPRLIVCDEPVAALDVSVRAHVLNLLADLQEEFGISYLFISHDLALVEVFADRVAVMQAGQILELQPAADLYRQPQHDYTKRLLGAIPKLPPSSIAVMEAEAKVLEADILRRRALNRAAEAVRSA
ncbi:MAG: putative oligopeptide/dipeptide transporter ATPase subunit [Actinomycetia bacterium]|nr:putative oligopeptide/dipeptide transporter ATPase subunit [Actinomycetes bacterium]